MLKYTNIKLLVHPLFVPVYSYIIERKISKEEFLRIIKINLGEYGKVVLECKKEPNTLFVLVDPYTDHFIALDRRLRISYNNSWGLFKSIYNKLIKKFKEFAKRQLKDSFVVTDYHSLYQTEYLPKNIATQLAKKVRVESFGEYADRCVNAWSDFLKKDLEKYGVSVSMTKNDRKSRFSVFSESNPLHYRDNLNVRAMTAKKSRVYRKKLSNSKILK